MLYHLAIAFWVILVLIVGYSWSTNQPAVMDEWFAFIDVYLLIENKWER